MTLRFDPWCLSFIPQVETALRAVRLSAAAPGPLSLRASVPLMRPLAPMPPCQRAPCDSRRTVSQPFTMPAVPPRDTVASGLQLRETDVQERAAFGGEDAGVPIRRELHAIALGELGALDGVGAV